MQSNEKQIVDLKNRASFCCLNFDITYLEICDFEIKRECNVYYLVLQLIKVAINMNRLFSLFLFLFIFFQSLKAQEAQFPIVKDFGGIYEIPEATVLPDFDGTYKIVIDVVSGLSEADHLSPSLNNVARLMNLHGLGGVRRDQMQIVLAIHGDATTAILNNGAYRKRFQVDNPNLKLIEALKNAGVKLAVCGQSLLAHQIEPSTVTEEVEIALSMLTTVTTYQMSGYAFLRF